MNKGEREKEFLERITDTVICYNSYGESISWDSSCDK